MSRDSRGLVEDQYLLQLTVLGLEVRVVVMVDSLVETFSSRLSQLGLVEVIWDMVSMDQFSRCLQLLVSTAEVDIADLDVTMHFSEVTAVTVGKALDIVVLVTVVPVQVQILVRFVEEFIRDHVIWLLMHVSDVVN